MKPYNRKLLPDADGTRTTQSPSILTYYSPLPLLQPINASSTVRKPFKPNTPFDSSMALTILVLLTALFFMGFFSIYIRRFADENSVDLSRRRRHHGPSPSASSSSGPTSRTTTAKGLHPSTVRSLPLFSYRGDAKQPIDCPVCLSEFQDKDRIKIIPYCRHVFHPECIDRWLSSHVSCPLCRSTQLFPVKDGSLGVVLEGLDQGVSESLGRSTAESSRDTEVGMRRTSSCSSLGERVSLQRTSSF